MRSDLVVYENQPLYFSFWRFDEGFFGDEFLFYEDVPNESVFDWVFPEQFGIRFFGYYEYGVDYEIPQDFRDSVTLVYFVEFFDDNGNSVSYYSPLGHCYYDSMYLYLSIDDVNGDLYEAYLETDITRFATEHWNKSDENYGYEVFEGISFRNSGEYRVDCYLQFFYQNSAAGYIYDYYDFTVMDIEDDYISNSVEYYKSGYDKGYLDGKNKGIEQSEEWSVYRLISAVFNAPITFLSGALNFEIFGINLWYTVQFIFTAMLVLFVVVVILRMVK